MCSWVENVLTQSRKGPSCLTQVTGGSKMATFTVHEGKHNRSNNTDLFSNSLRKYNFLERMGMTDDESIGAALLLLEGVWFGSLWVSYLPSHRDVLRDNIAVLEELQWKCVVQMTKQINSQASIFMQNNK